MKTSAVIVVLATALFTAPASSDHNRTDEQGRKESHWTEISDHGDLFEGHYVDGERRGPWSARFANGFVGECIYAKDPGYCDWVVRDADGDALKVEWHADSHSLADLYTNRQRLFWRSANSGALESPFVNGKKHGYWIAGDAGDSVMAEGPYKDGKKHGHWVMRFADGEDNGEVRGDVWEGPYVDGKEHGYWVMRFADGDEWMVWKGAFVDGEEHGPWVARFANGDVGGGQYVDGKPHGPWVVQNDDGDMEEGPYVDGKKHGKWVVRKASGDAAEKCFENGNEVDC